MHGSDIDLGNERGKNSFIENGFQGGDLTPGGGGAKIKFMKHLPNALSYLQKGLRDVTGAIDQYNNMRSVFGDENTNEMDTLHGNFNPNLSGMPQSFIDSIAQDNINSSPDSIYSYSFFDAYKNGEARRINANLTDSIILLKVKNNEFDSIKRR